MSAPDRWSRVEALYHAARERDAGERAAFLDAACVGDTDLRREVESLLAQPTDEGFLSVPAMAVAAQMITSPASEPVSDLSDAMTTLTPPSASRTPSGAGSGAAARLAPGQTFGPYRIVRLLGPRRAWARSTRPNSVEQGRRVALKVLSQRLTDPQDRARFLREGQLAASINHPNSVYIFGSEEIAGTPVIAMELLAGGTLKDRVREQGPLPPAEAVDAILQVIAGLDAAQAGGILHRDIKPANCFVDRDGTVKVGDFGLSISTMARDVTQLTKTGTFQGTPQFAAPEQLQGRAAGCARGHLRGGRDALLPAHRPAAVRRHRSDGARHADRHRGRRARRARCSRACRADSRRSCCAASPRTERRVPRPTPRWTRRCGRSAPPRRHPRRSGCGSWRERSIWTIVSLPLRR